jgi:hypothetical protein
MMMVIDLRTVTWTHVLLAAILAVTVWAKLDGWG